MTRKDYMSNAINNFEEKLENDGVSPLNKFRKKAGQRSFPIRYRPDIYVSPLVNDELYSQ